MRNLINIEFLKNHSFLDKNIDNKIVAVAIESIHLGLLDDILGRCLYEKLEALICSGEISAKGNEKYYELLERYIVPLVANLVQEKIALPITFKERNAGVLSTADSSFTSASLAAINELRAFYRNEANLIQIKLIEYLRCHYLDFPELNCPSDCDPAECCECDPCCGGGKLLQPKLNLGFHVGPACEGPTLREEMTSTYNTDVRWR